MKRRRALSSCWLPASAKGKYASVVCEFDGMVGNLYLLLCVEEVR